MLKKNEYKLFEVLYLKLNSIKINGNVSVSPEVREWYQVWRSRVLVLGTNNLVMCSYLTQISEEPEYL